MTDEPGDQKFRVEDKRVKLDDAGGLDREGAERRAGGLDREEDAPTSEQISDELDEAARLAADRLDQLMRLKADYENFRKRVIREQTEIVERASLRIVEQLLPVLDNFERAMNAARTHATDEALLKGVELVHRQLHDVLSSEGLERLEAQGQPFDPHEHEAMQSEPGEVAEPTVLEVVRPGYRLKGKTIRAALVKVATPADPNEEGQAEE